MRVSLLTPSGAAAACNKTNPTDYVTWPQWLTTHPPSPICHSFHAQIFAPTSAPPPPKIAQQSTIKIARIKPCCAVLEHDYDAKRCDAHKHIGCSNTWVIFLAKETNSMRVFVCNTQPTTTMRPTDVVADGKTTHGDDEA